METEKLATPLWLRAEKTRKTLELDLSEVLTMKSYKELPCSKSFAVKSDIAFRRESRKNYKNNLSMNCKVLGHIRSGERTKHEKCESSAAMSWSKAAIVVEARAGPGSADGQGEEAGGGGNGYREYIWDFFGGIHGWEFLRWFFLGTYLGNC